MAESCAALLFRQIIAQTRRKLDLRAKSMSAFVPEGDTTDHGGKVLNCLPNHKVDGGPIARLGDMMSCRKCGGVYPIVEVLQRGISMDGKPPAFKGDKTACGATLIAS
ncbi:putative Zn-binding protein involved in type VI secretion [Paraburkholderia caledonica]|uniref:Zn-binding protein involved in type VI secretion n=1 Tax=Paraburkholderia caledonica TaxID=134536 RepID=A0AB73IV19_9BURK|nr:putative Zn-binding protein involved in type VI secretion [Paraburkholderia caledonica]